MRYIDADKLKSEINRLKGLLNSPLCESLTKDYKGGGNKQLDLLFSFIDSLQQDETQVDKMLCSQVWWEEQGWIMIPPDATIEGIDSLLRQVRKKLQQEQPSEICSKCIYHGKDDDYCYNPHGGIRSLINENGVYECTGFCEQEQPDLSCIEESGIPGKDYIPVEWVDACENYGKWKIVKQEQPEMDLEKEYKEYVEDDPVFSILTNRNVGLTIARHFYELGKNG